MRGAGDGGNRYIGLDLVFELARRGARGDGWSTSHEAPLPDGARRIQCDRTEPGALADALAPHRDAFDAIFDHTAYRLADMAPLLELFAGRVQHYVFTSSQAASSAQLRPAATRDLAPPRTGQPRPARRLRGRQACSVRGSPLRAGAVG